VVLAEHVDLPPARILTKPPVNGHNLPTEPPA
jgi:hypothetical protein